MNTITDLIATPFGFDSTAAEVAAGIDLSGKRAVVTGAASGIGIETARALAGTGADVTLAYATSRQAHGSPPKSPSRRRDAGVAWYAVDGAIAERLWDESLRMLG